MRRIVLIVGFAASLFGGSVSTAETLAQRFTPANCDIIQERGLMRGGAESGGFRTRELGLDMVCSIPMLSSSITANNISRIVVTLIDNHPRADGVMATLCYHRKGSHSASCSNRVGSGIAFTGWKDMTVYPVPGTYSASYLPELHVMAWPAQPGWKGSLVETISVYTK